MSWHKILIPAGESEKVFQLEHDCEQRRLDAGRPPDFKIAHREEFDEGPNVGHTAYYFSPVAYALCSDLLAEYNPTSCDAPK
jgi:hypothetical protein